ncbi:MAG TPA: adenylate/guanylate cyclase domain-containing protein [Candidatus Limnocylindria bacterium]
MPEERRVVTVLFADVTGSTAIGEANDPEDVRALLGRYYAIAREVVAEHGGTIEKFIGDAVMAVFGIPQAHGDDAERALAAALALRDRVTRDPQTSGLALRMGVNTGEVVATREADAGDFLVTGDAVNVAARLQQNAEPGTIIAGERTMRAASGFRFGEEQRIAVKGKRDPIVGAVLLERMTERRAPRTPFLGREHDLAQLELVAKRAFSERRPQLVTITAPAGTGKSRLVEEFVMRLGPGRTIATAQCLPYGAAVTFLPLRGLVRGLLHLGSDEDPLPALRRTLSDSGYSEEDASRIAALIGATLGDASETERHDRDEIFFAWKLLIEKLATTGPLVVVFEDLHWASDTLLDLVEHVTVSRTSAPLVMVALARPELLDRRPAWGGGRRSFTSLALEPLTEEETRQLVAVLTEGVPNTIADRIVERAGGNPFFAGELVRAYEARRREGLPDTEIVLPDTVHATVLAQIDALPQTERATIEYAAVTGRTARVSTLSALLPDEPRERIVESLEALVDREMLVPQGNDAYTFRHIVIREVAYATLPRAERVRAHVALARWLEADDRTRGNELAELVAYHYRQALALSPGGRMPEGLEAPRVVAAFERAARTAAAGAAFGEAAQQIREAIRIAPEADHLRLYESLGDITQFGDDAIAGYAEAFDRWTALGSLDPAIGARLLIKRLSTAGRWAGSLTSPLQDDDFAQLTTRARELLDAAPDEYLEAKLACARIFDYSRRVNLDPLLAVSLAREVERAVEFFGSRDDADSLSEALDAASVLSRYTGDYEGAYRAQLARVAKADRLGLIERVDAASSVCWDLVYLGRYDEAVARWGDAQRLLRPGEPVFMMAHASGWAGYAAMLSGDWAAATRLGEVLLEMREEAPIPLGRFSFPGWIAAIRVASAQMDVARLARLRSAFAAVANVGALDPGKRPLWEAFVTLDAQMAREAVVAPYGTAERKGELITLILYDAGEQLTNEELATIEQTVAAKPPCLAMRLALARALNGPNDDLRAVVAQLDDADLLTDAARAATFLALRTHANADRANAERRLTALGDRLFLQKLAEEW